MRTAAAILDDALQLTDEERADLAFRLSCSLEPETAASEEELREAGAAEAVRRLDRVLAGEVRPVPLEEAAARVRRALRDRKR